MADCKLTDDITAIRFTDNVGETKFIDQVCAPSGGVVVVPPPVSPRLNFSISTNGQYLPLF